MSAKRKPSRSFSPPIVAVALAFFLGLAMDVFDFVDKVSSWLSIETPDLSENYAAIPTYLFSDDPAKIAEDSLKISHLLENEITPIFKSQIGATEDAVIEAYNDKVVGATKEILLAACDSPDGADCQDDGVPIVNAVLANIVGIRIENKSGPTMRNVTVEQITYEFGGRAYFSFSKGFNHIEECGDPITGRDAAGGKQVITPVASTKRLPNLSKEEAAFFPLYVANEFVTPTGTEQELVLERLVCLKSLSFGSSWRRQTIPLRWQVEPYRMDKGIVGLG